ncbi:hypothetical protein FGO68_gene1576 [Halteria grandinella]|uniref:Uncharacterized protein n=1 Tax=Halteria grandinella TaxID=5974 RepID=A0A8J8P397_HALGN|nr:hypothetical protein FGO68_gene1576 [Halteria grandinella]
MLSRAGTLAGEKKEAPQEKAFKKGRNAKSKNLFTQNILFKIGKKNEKQTEEEKKEAEEAAVQEEEHELIEKANNIPKAPKGRRRYIDFLLGSKMPQNEKEKEQSQSPKKNEIKKPVIYTKSNIMEVKISTPALIQKDISNTLSYPAIPQHNQISEQGFNGEQRQQSPHLLSTFHPSNTSSSPFQSKPPMAQQPVVPNLALQLKTIQNPIVSTFQNDKQGQVGDDLDHLRFANKPSPLQIAPIGKKSSNTLLSPNNSERGGGAGPIFQSTPKSVSTFRQLKEKNSSKLLPDMTAAGQDKRPSYMIKMSQKDSKDKLDNIRSQTEQSSNIQRGATHNFEYNMQNDEGDDIERKNTLQLAPKAKNSSKLLTPVSRASQSNLNGRISRKDSINSATSFQKLLQGPNRKTSSIFNANSGGGAGKWGIRM